MVNLMNAYHALVAVFFSLAVVRADGADSAQLGGEPTKPQSTRQTSTIEISRARVFPERLHPGRRPSEAENEALLQAIAKFSTRTNRDDVAPLADYLEEFPDGAWAVSLRTELGCEYDRTGWYSKAIASWEQVWGARANVEPSEALIALHRAGSHLAVRAPAG